MQEFSHLDSDGNIRMVDISGKKQTARQATARGRISMAAETVQKIITHEISKGNVLTTASLAGIQAAKNTSQLIPLCHQINLTHVDVRFFPGKDFIEIEAVARTDYATGVEMEALTAVSVAALTIYDMSKAVDKNMVISEIRLISKSGGKSGDG